MIRTGLCGLAFAVLLTVGQVDAQNKPRVADKIEPACRVDLAEVSLAANVTCVRVTINPGTITDDHSHAGRSALIIPVQGILTEWRGTVANDYKPGDVVHVPEGAMHHAQNKGTVPVIYIEVNTRPGALPPVAR